MHNYYTSVTEKLSIIKTIVTLQIIAARIIFIESVD